MQQIIVREANQNDVDTVFLLLKEAALWLRKKGIDYWQDWISPPPNYVSWINRGFESNEFYIVESEGVTIGCFRIQWQDPRFWGERQDEAGYIHSFTVIRNLTGQGMGYRILNLIETCCRNNQKNILRLDCGTHVTGLRKYYESYGFKHVGEANVSGEHLALYEKQIA